ncbi:hypothetical protein SK128_004601 [Halocaridina rubra]|uniref:Uncharacterized protein n=1 Tax=Halocaridina rubra TaxID=373956 RepID=A0AAN8X9R9_HALRR
MRLGNRRRNLVDNGASGGRTRDVCGQCDAVVTNRGKNSVGLFCDYCSYWYYARCEGMSTDTYQMFRSLCKSEDREVRAKTVMFTGIVESRNGDKDVRKQEDIGKIKALPGNDLGIDLEKVMITNAITIGKQNMRNEDNRPNSRLIKVMFENEKMVSLLTKSAKKLSKLTDEDIKNIKIFRDMSKSDHEKRILLVEEMKKRNQELHDNGISDMK